MRTSMILILFSSLVAGCADGDGGGGGGEGLAPGKADSPLPAGGLEPFVLVSGLTEPAALALDRNNLFVSELGNAITGDRLKGLVLTPNALVEELPLDGASAAVLADGQIGIASLALDAAGLYWVTTGSHAADFRNGTVVGLDRSTLAVEVVAASRVLPADVAIDEAFVYWAEVDGGVVARAPRGGPREIVNLATSGDGSPLSVAVTEERVYYAISGAGSDVSALDKASGAVTELSHEERLADSLVADGADLFWIDHSERLRVSRDLAPAVDLVPPDDLGARNLVLAGRHLYWSAADGIHRVPAAGGAAETVVEGAVARSLAADSGLLCWTDPDAGAVMCVALPSDA